MRNVLGLCLVMTLVFPAAHAQSPDTIGLWFDPGYSVNVAPLTLNTPFEAYLVLHEPSADALAGAEFTFEVSDPTVLVLGAEWPGDPMVQVVDGCTQIAYGAPRPTTPATLLTVFTFMVVNEADAVYFTVGPCAGEVCPYYIPPGLPPVCLETTLGDGFVACLGDCSVGVEATNGSAVKSLYR